MSHKNRKPRHIQIPVLPALPKDLRVPSPGPLPTPPLAPSAEAFDLLADLMEVVSVALKDTGGCSAILESGKRALQDVADRAARTGKIGLGRFELLPIENAVVECEALVKQLDVMRLYQARIKTPYTPRISRAVSHHTNQKELCA